MTRINSRQKGKRVELQVVHWLRGLGFTEARRGQQFAGGNDSPDVIVSELPNLHLECKGRQRWPSPRELEEFMQQAERDCGVKRPIVVLVLVRRAPLLCYRDRFGGISVLASGNDDSVVCTALMDWETGARLARETSAMEDAHA